jgi:DNA-binding NarL/FixJ family response regulator
MDATQAVAVLLVSEQLVVRESLRKLLEDEPGIVVVGDASSADEAMALGRTLKPVMVVVGFPGRRLIRMLRSLRPLTPAGERGRTIVLATQLDEKYVGQALQLGVSRILLKETSSRTLVDALRSVAAGEWDAAESGRTSTSTISCDAGRSAATPSTKPHFGLTSRELEIIAAVRRGDSNRAIARRFSLSQHTVKHHLTRVFDKTGVFSRLELALFAAKNGLGDGLALMNECD